MRTPDQVGAEIIEARELFLAAELAGDTEAADEHEAAMNRAVEEYGRIPHPRLPSDQPIRIR